MRIGNIEYRNDFQNEIVCWYPNSYYGRESEYNWTYDGEFAYKDDVHCRIHKDCFKRKESCYVIAFVEYCEDDEPDIRSVGSRFLKLSKDDFKDYIEVCKMIFEENKKNNYE